ncbi:ATP-binding protein [Saccharopolyspora rosea]|nr:ATP-binding protein [Saccharopolyspora rosea]
MWLGPAVLFAFAVVVLIVGPSSATSPSGWGWWVGAAAALVVAITSCALTTRAHRRTVGALRGQAAAADERAELLRHLAEQQLPALAQHAPAPPWPETRTGDDTTRALAHDCAAQLHHAHERRRAWAAVAEERAELLRHLAEQQLPALAQHAPAPPWPETRTGDDTTRALAHDCAAQLEQVRDRQLGRDDVVHAAVASLARKVQSSAHRIQDQAAELTRRYENDPEVLEIRFQIDHAAAQQARQAQSLAVLCDEQPGQQWRRPVSLEDIAHAARGRITAYQRVEVSGNVGVAVTPPKVEPLIHLISELLANATQSSAPIFKVLVTVRQVQRGAVIEIDDCGNGVQPQLLAHLRDIASGDRVVGLAELGEAPQTGLAVVGRYVRHHGFRVDLANSVYGGLRAIVFIPGDYLQTATEPPAVGKQAQRSHAAEPVERKPAAPVTEQAGETPQLPQRRSRRGDVAPQPAESKPLIWPPERGETRSPEEVGQWMARFFGASAKAPATPETTDDDREE